MSVEIEISCVIDEAEKCGFCQDCEALHQTANQTETTPAEYDCPAVDDNDGCLYI